MNSFLVGQTGTRLAKLWREGYGCGMVMPEDITEGEWADWYRLTPLERWRESQMLWEYYLAIGGSLDPEPDTESPFYDGSPPSPRPVDGRPGWHIVRHGPI
jgi:hypothetical protein